MEHNRLEEAFAFASRLHANQRRKGSAVPYIAHLMSVSALVLEHGGTQDQAIGALLHDAVEDQGDHYPGGPAAHTTEIRDPIGDTAPPRPKQKRSPGSGVSKLTSIIWPRWTARRCWFRARTRFTTRGLS
jgi:hypothetical protein